MPCKQTERTRKDECCTKLNMQGTSARSNKLWQLNRKVILISGWTLKIHFNLLLFDQIRYQGWENSPINKTYCEAHVFSLVIIRRCSLKSHGKY
jgi:hypothetical protein